MNKNMVAHELLMVAKELMAIPWTQLDPETSTSERRYSLLDSLTSFAPKMNIRVRHDAIELLSQQDFRIVSANDLKLEWSEYLVFKDPPDHNKYHYYVVYSYNDATGVKRYSAFNCSGKVGYVERVYDLTEKYLGGPALTAARAQDAAEMHMKTKLRKGYEHMSMIRG